MWDFPSGLHKREVAAWVLSEALGWGIVPPTVLRDDGPLGEGSLQLFVPADFEQHYFTLHDRVETHPALMTIATLDLIMNNTDRKSGHCLLGLDGRIYAIDNGLCFAAEPKLRTVIWEFGGDRIPSELVDDVAADREGGAARHAGAARSRRGRCGAPPVEGDRGEAGLPGRHLGAALSLANGVTSLERVVEEGDLDELVRTVDRLCSTRDWDGLVELRDRCRWALERGKQLWPAASLAEYRLALEAPGKWAAGVITEGAGRFALGPLPEVAASSHTWAELSPHLAPGPLAAITAHERVVRGEDLSADESIDRSVLEVPLALCAWEPAYPLAEYHADKAEFPMPRDAGLTQLTLAPFDVVEDASTVDALLGLTSRWTTESDGRAEAIAVRGSAAGAVGALGVRRAARRRDRRRRRDGAHGMGRRERRRARPAPRDGGRPLRHMVGGRRTRRRARRLAARLRRGRRRGAVAALVRLGCLRAQDRLVVAPSRRRSGRRPRLGDRRHRPELVATPAPDPGTDS